MVKPSWGRASRGIRTSTDPEELIQHVRGAAQRKFSEWRVERYIERPLLVRGRKFHLGMYMLLLRHRDWPAARVLFHNDQIFVPALAEYRHSNWSDHDVHDTHASNLGSTRCGSAKAALEGTDSSTENASPPVLSRPQAAKLQAGLRRLEDACRAAVDAIGASKVGAYASLPAQVCYTMWRLDVMVEETDLRPVLLEFNSVPGTVHVEKQFLCGLLRFCTQSALDAFAEGKSGTATNQPNPAGASNVSSAAVAPVADAADASATSTTAPAAAAGNGERGSAKRKADSMQDSTSTSQGEAGADRSRARLEKDTQDCTLPKPSEASNATVLDASRSPSTATEGDLTESLRREVLQAMEELVSTGGAKSSRHASDVGVDVVDRLLKKFPAAALAAWTGPLGGILHYLAEALSIRGLESALLVPDFDVNKARDRDGATVLHVANGLCRARRRAPLPRPPGSLYVPPPEERLRKVLLRMRFDQIDFDLQDHRGERADGTRAGGRHHQKDPDRDHNYDYQDRQPRRRQQTQHTPSRHQSLYPQRSRR
eukprot:INCI16228.1.p1 GENE.INCI16228.1~~INCI16228.1.p1  ORF type:complete len:567 (-),score=97.28 INCI16228.1:1169-2791(-)